MILIVSMPLQEISGSPVSSEYKLKAALIYKLTKFVDWPPSEGSEDKRSFGICLLGRDDFGAALDALSERTVKGEEIRVSRYAQSDEIGEHCRVLFISDSKQPFMQTILDAIGNRPILTVSDTEQFAAKGGVIQFTSGEKRIGFVINLQRATASGLKIASPLLDLATVIGPKTTGVER